jgi:hypothetical protein
VLGVRCRFYVNIDLGIGDSSKTTTIEAGFDPK